MCDYNDMQLAEAERNIVLQLGTSFVKVRFDVTLKERCLFIANFEYTRRSVIHKNPLTTI